MSEIKKSSQKEPEVPLNRDIPRLARKTRRLAKVSPKHLDDAICDIIDLGGSALGVLIRRIPGLPENVQTRVAMKVEDFLFFHPARGRRFLKRLMKSVKESSPACRPYLLSALADVSSRVENLPIDLAFLESEALAVIEAGTDLLRKGKAVEILGSSGHQMHIPTIIKAMEDSLDGIENYANYQFVETALFALKRLGGESLLRLLVNPTSPEANRLLHLEWRDRPEEQVKDLLKLVQGLDEQFGPLLLKLIDLSEYNLPFVSLIREGLEHPDKWVRQSAAASLKKIGDESGFEHLERMLHDPAVEVRLMAISSMGSYSIETTGELLTNIALDESETPEIRLNSLYSLFSQKNFQGLQTLKQCPTVFLAANAVGLHSLLMAREDGLKELLEGINGQPKVARHELFHYLYELAWPEDLPRLLQFNSTFQAGEPKEEFLVFMISYLKKNAGPKLDRTIKLLPESEQVAIRVLVAGRLGADPDSPKEPS